MKERIIDFLAQGMKPSQVASIVGCTAGYVTQVSKDPSNEEKIREKQVALLPTLTEDKVLNNKYMAVEHTLLNQLESMAGMAEFRDVTRALEVVGNRQEKRLARLTAPAGGSGSGTNVLINLTLPAHATLNLPSYQLNEKNEVISIGERAMAPMSSDAVKNLFAAINGTAAKTVEDDGKTIEMATQTPTPTPTEF